jgi:glycosyltransferase involved in cell wall biosynthesis
LSAIDQTPVLRRPVTGRCGLGPASPDRRRLRIAVIASARYPIREPFAGGLEVHTWQLASRLTERGHHICVFAGPGSVPDLHVHEIPAPPPVSAIARQDVSMPPDYFLAEHFAYLSLMLELAADDSYDLVHNNSLHYLPIAMADSLRIPMVTTLHTPPTPWLELAMATRPSRRVRYAAVSQRTADQWQPSVPDATVVRNGVDLERWTPGPGGGSPVWCGRIVPEKGLDLAIRAARLARTGLRIAGPRPDRAYFTDRIEPLLGDGIQYVGHLDHADLATLVGSARVAVVSPCWDEPYGLVVAEALACGTPVAAFARGALPELVDRSNGVLADPDDIDGLAQAIAAAARLDRTAVRESAERTCSIGAMIDGYERLYRELVV